MSEMAGIGLRIRTDAVERLQSIGVTDPAYLADVKQRLAEQEAQPPLRYLVNFSSWQSGTHVLDGSLDNLLTDIREEVKNLTDGDDLTIHVKARRMTEAECDALPEWDGP